MTAWADIPVVRLSLASALDDAIASWRNNKRAVVGLAFAPLEPGPAFAASNTAETSTDELWLAYAPSPEATLEQTQVFAIAFPIVERLAEYLRESGAPYCVFANAHIDLARLRRSDVHPRRFGCIRTAATLLGEGADGRRDDRPLEWCTRAALGVELPPLAARETLAARAAVLIPILRAFTGRLRTLGLVPSFELECHLLPTVLDMEQKGMPVDAAGFERVAAGWVRERESATDAARIARLDKLLSTYRYWGRDYLGFDGRMRYQLEPLATDSGRFACSSPNLQQVPSEHTAPGLRACFRPDDRHRFVVADYAQIELRVAAHVAGCNALRQVFRRGGDPHRATAATLTGKAEEAVTDHERKLAKAINFGFLFGMGARRFQSYAHDSFGIELSLEEAQRARGAFLATFPGIAAWHKRTAAMQDRNRREDVIVSTVLGRRKRFPVGEFSFSTALNIPVQGTAAEGFKQAMIDVQAPLRAVGGEGVLCVHDEYIAEVPAEGAERACEIVKGTLETSMGRIVDSVPIVVEARVVEHWS